MTSFDFAPLLCLLALALALAFRRHRAALLLASTTLAVAALTLPPEQIAGSRAASASVMFLPWFWLLALLLPEPPLRSRRMLAFAVLLGLAAWLCVMAPEHVWRGFEHVLPLGWLAARPGRIALVLSLLACAIAAAQWAWQRRPLDAALALALLAASFGWIQLAGLELRHWLLVSAAATGLGVVYSSWRLAFLDALTGLPNRRALDETLARLSGDYALAMVDVDHFKQFNDKYGHDAGDRVLVAVARSLAQTSAAHAFRFGGEEFCLLFRRPELARQACEDARLAIENLRVALPRKPAAKADKAAAKPARKSETTVQVTASIGVAPRNPQRRAASEVLKAADQCLYKAKGKGRNQVVATA